MDLEKGMIVDTDWYNGVILRNRTLGMETRLRVLHYYIHLVLMYGSEA